MSGLRDTVARAEPHGDAAASLLSPASEALVSLFSLPACTASPQESDQALTQQKN